MHFVYLLIIGVISLCSLRAMSPEQLEAARDTIRRTVPECGIADGKVELLTLDKEDGKDVFEVSVKDGILTVKGSSPVALCHGFYKYMKREGIGMVTWNGRRVEWPAKLKDSAPWKVVSPVKHHYYLNVVTYGYTMPYWDWERWQQEIDWMALHGIDMPLALVGTEAIATRVWKQIGLTQAEIDRFYTGPAHLPWQRMGNIVRHDGPLYDEWNKSQVALQHKILARMKEMAMKPICPAFAGFVPKEITRLHPDVKLLKLGWGGWGQQFASHLLSPETPLFQEIGKRFITEWEKEFGKSDYYLADSFNEMEIPAPRDNLKLRHEILASLGEQVYKSISSANPDAVWVMQGWMFGYMRSTWTPDSVKAMLSKVPDDKMLLLDLAADYNKHFWRNGMNWDFYSGFYNKQWVYSVVPNMGGKSGYTGPLEFYANGHLEALQSPNKGDLAGIGMAPEGIENNEMIYELLADAAWCDTKTDLDQWLKEYAIARYGAYPDEIREAWSLLRKTAYASLLDHPRFVWQFRPGRVSKGSLYGVLGDDFEKAVDLFVKAGEKNFGSSAPVLYQDDMIEMAVHVIGMRMEELAIAMRESFLMGDKERAGEQMKHFRVLANAADSLLESHHTHSLSRWVEYASKQTDNKELKEKYQRNAKRLVSVWGPPIDDYSARMWSGLIKGYYLARWEAWYKANMGGDSVDWPKWEADWVDNYNAPASANSTGNLLALVNETLSYCKSIPAKLLTTPEGHRIGDWTPANITNEWKEVRWTLGAEDLKTIKAVRFNFTKGANAVDIRNVRIIADGVEVAKDEHQGRAGTPASNNMYPLKVPSSATGNNECVLSVELKGVGGTDSSGIIEMIK